MQLLNLLFGKLVVKQLVLWLKVVKYNKFKNVSPSRMLTIRFVLKLSFHGALALFHDRLSISNRFVDRAFMFNDVRLEFLHFLQLFLHIFRLESQFQRSLELLFCIFDPGHQFINVLLKFFSFSKDLKYAQ